MLHLLLLLLFPSVLLFSQPHIHSLLLSLCMCWHVFLPFCFVLNRFPNFLSSLVHWMAGKSSSLRFRVPAMPGWETGITRDPPVPLNIKSWTLCLPGIRRPRWLTCSRTRYKCTHRVPAMGEHRPSYTRTKKNGEWGGCQVNEKKKRKKIQVKIAKTNVRRNAGIVGKPCKLSPTVKFR